MGQGERRVKSRGSVLEAEMITIGCIAYLKNLFLRKSVGVPLLILLSFQTNGTKAEEMTFVYAVQISAVVQISPPQITLHWEPDPLGANSYTIYRKSKNDTAWGSGTTLPGSASS